MHLVYETSLLSIYRKSTTYDFVVEMYQFFFGGGGARVPLAFRLSAEVGPRLELMERRRRLGLSARASTCRRLRVERRPDRRRQRVNPLERVQLLHDVHDAEMETCP